MKKLVYLFITALVITSCSIDSDTQNVSYEIMPIDSVEMPEVFLFGETHEINMTYTTGGDCYEFYNYFYEINGNERTIAVINTVYQDDCNDIAETVTATLEFTVTSTETYLFRFYIGENEEGVDEYHLIEVPVEMPD